MWKHKECSLSEGQIRVFLGETSENLQRGWRIFEDEEEEESSHDKEEEFLFAEREHIYFCYLSDRKCVR